MAASEFVTIGKLSNAAGVLPSTIRFYVQNGLLEVADRTPGGFQLFDLPRALERVKHIRDLQSNKRLTVAEIKEYFSQSQPN